MDRLRMFHPIQLQEICECVEAFVFTLGTNLNTHVQWAIHLDLLDSSAGHV